MNCKYCSFQNSNDAQVCANCGKPIERNIVSIDMAKFQKKLKDTGTSVAAIGWLTIVGNVGLCFWSFLDKNYSSGGLPKIDISGAMLMIIFSSIIIILGNRVSKTVNKNTRRYLIILLVLFIIAPIWALASGGIVGVLLILVLIYLISALVSINKAMKVEEFTSTLIAPEYKIKKMGWVIFGVVSAILLIAAFSFDFYRIKTYQYPGYSKPETIKKIVAQAKAAMTLPKQVDEVTTLVDITPQPDAVRYESVLSSTIDKSKISNEALKNLLIPGLCSNQDTKKLLDSDINMEYSYTVASSTDAYFVLVTKNDCMR